MKKNRFILCLIYGFIGCLCFGGGDWLMMYGNKAYSGNNYWLTEGVADISAWRNTLAMLLAFPGIVFYGVALFSLEAYIIQEKHKRTYHQLTIYGLTPWLCLHLFYIMILYTFAWMNQNGYAEVATPVCEALFSHFSWIVLVSEAMMLSPFIYWFYLQVSSKTIFPKRMALWFGTMLIWNFWRSSKLQDK